MPESLDLSKIDEVLTHYREERGALIPVLQEAQNIYGFLPEGVLRRISRKLNVPMSRIYGVITFYAQFYLTRQGRHKVRACRGTACHVRGARAVLKTIENHLGIADGQTTEDYDCSLETVACLGACALAPVMVVDKKYYGKMNPKKAKTILENL